MAEFGPPRDDLIEHTTPAKDCVCGPARVEATASKPGAPYGRVIGDVWIHRRLDRRNRGASA